MNKKLLLICTIITLCLATSVSAVDNIYEYDKLTLQQTVTNSIDIIPSKDNYKVSYLETYLHLVPQQDYRQLLLQEEILPQATSINDSLLFRWEDITEGTYTFTSSFTVQTSNWPYPVKEKIPFPVQGIPEDIEKYVETTDFINIDQDIQNLATQIAQGEDDLFLLVHKLGTWVTENIEYNLSTISAEANIPSTEVMRVRQGVCDELTNLFISLNRALGIPARFVSGIAYSDSILFDEKWGNHGWAEVYFPEVGWVPYDVTYGQYGYIDATHIALSKQIDGSQPSVNYYALGHSFDFEPDQLDFETIVIGSKEDPLNPTTIDIEIKEDVVGLNSHNLVTATIRNNLDSYYVEELYLGQTENIEILDDDRFTIALLPGEEKKVTWLIKINNRLDQGYIYTFPMVLFNGRYEEFRTEFEVRDSGNRFGPTYLEQFRVENEATTEDAGTVGCTSPSQVHVDESFVITCSGEEAIKACLADTCHSGTQASFSVTPTTTGIQTKKITITSDGQTVERFVTYRVVDTPELVIASVDFPQEMKYGEEAPLKIKLDKLSASSPLDVTVIIDHQLWQEVWKFPVLDQDKILELNVGSNNLKLNENIIDVQVTYSDEEGNEYEAKSSTQTNFVVDTFGQKIKVIAGNAAFWIDKQLKKTVA